MPDFAEIDRTLEALRGLHIGTNRDADFTTQLDRLLRRDEEGHLLPDPVRMTSTGESRGVLVVDGRGGGKSTLVARALRKHPVLAEGQDGRPHYLSSVVPSPATFKSMTLELLERSGYPEVSSRREAWGMWQLLRDRLTMLGVTVLWIDEAHDLFCADRNLILRAVKALMQGDHPIIVVLSGTEQLRDIVRSDPQVQRRFSSVQLPPVSVVADGDTFDGVIEHFCARAGLEPPSDEDLLDRLFHASRYRFGRVIETIIGAIERALISDDASLDLDHFADAWAMQEGCPLSRNIFRADEWNLIDPDHREEPEALPRQRKRRTRRG
ncbi:TniB family NTP-binding protein [Salipiger mucosus]|uniref:Transposition protein, putative n=1 Tax=Salipiger mucosus DSM 16094 TaxID=1123237 RepID=S9RQZ2_9RHOB|nr:TniB family NTP-binding protein [Salipiger mucosus]EPX76419.1 transposition protein, putative [Salipiger mucosus DSM 16094]